MKKSFYLFCDSLSIIDKLTDEQNWKLLKMMRSYHNWENYAPNDFVVEIAFEQFKNQFDRDLETYNNVCERNSLNWAKWWRPRKNPENPSGYLETQGNPEKPKKADKDKDTDKDTDKKKDNYSLELQELQAMRNEVDEKLKVPKAKVINPKAQERYKALRKTFEYEMVVDWFEKYMKNISDRKPWSDYYSHRWSLSEFIINWYWLEKYAS